MAASRSIYVYRVVWYGYRRHTCTTTRIAGCRKGATVPPLTVYAVRAHRDGSHASDSINIDCSRSNSAYYAIYVDFSTVDSAVLSLFFTSVHDITPHTQDS